MLSVAVARRVRDQLGVDLLDGNLAEVLKRVFSDTALLCDVLFLISNSNADPSNRVTDEDFGRAMRGDSIEEGVHALLEAVRDFTPSPSARARVGKLLDAVRAEMDRASATADQVVDAAIAKMEAARGGPTSSASPPKRTSNRGRTRSAN